MLQDTIAAISTAAQDGAISIVRMSGDEAISMLKNFLAVLYTIRTPIPLLMVIYLTL